MKRKMKRASVVAAVALALVGGGFLVDATGANVATAASTAQP